MISYLAFVIVVLWLAVRIVDSIRFAMGRPKDARLCNYAGTWKSHCVPIVAGRILVELPSPLPKGEPFKVKAFVYYKVTSLYRMGRFVPMEMEGLVDASGTTSGDNADDPVLLPPQVTFKFKAGAESGAQTIDYVSTADSEFTRIAGGYRSSSPNDIGTFFLMKTR